MIIYACGKLTKNNAKWSCTFHLSNEAPINITGRQKSTLDEANLQAIAYGLWYSWNKLKLNDEEIIIETEPKFIKIIYSSELKIASVCRKLITRLESTGNHVKLEAKNIVFISKHISNHQVFSKLFKDDNKPVQEIETFKEIEGYVKPIVFLKINDPEFSLFEDFHCQIYAVSKDGFKYPRPYTFPMLELSHKGSLGGYRKYGSLARSCYCFDGNERDAYEWFYKSLFRVFNYDNVDHISGTLLSQVDTYFHKIERYRLNTALSNWAMSKKMIVKSTDISSLGSGGYNCVFNVSKIEPNTALRIHTSPEYVFDSLAAKVLKEEHDTGFIHVKDYNEKFCWTSIPICKPIRENDFDNDKCKDMLMKIRPFMIQHPELFFVDYHKDNIMEYNDEYVIIDIDLNLTRPGQFEKMIMTNKLSQFIDKNVHIGWSMIPLACVYLNNKGHPVTNTTVSLFILEVYELANYEKWIVFNKETQDKLDEQIKKWIDQCK